MKVKVLKMADFKMGGKVIKIGRVDIWSKPHYSTI
jgi:hypothetical protein